MVANAGPYHCAGSGGEDSCHFFHHLFLLSLLSEEKKKKKNIHTRWKQKGRILSDVMCVGKSFIAKENEARCGSVIMTRNRPFLTADVRVKN